MLRDLSERSSDPLSAIERYFTSQGGDYGAPAMAYFVAALLGPASARAELQYAASLWERRERNALVAVLRHVEHDFARAAVRAIDMLERAEEAGQA